MVKMSKRLVDDSESDHNSSSDEDNGNFKRRRRHSSSDDFVTQTLKSFDTPEVIKPLNVSDSRRDQQMIKKQKVLNEKLSTLTKYDDLFDNSSDNCMQTNSVNSSDHSSLNKDIVVDSVRETQTIVSSVKVTNDLSDVLAGGHSEDVSKPISSDPRLQRMEKFKASEMESLPLSGPHLVRKLSEMLNNRKPHEAYNLLMKEVTPLQLHKYTDLLSVMAKDWFPAQIDTAFDPRAVFIEMTNLNSFSNLMKDVFTIKIKSKEFWESVIFSVEKFIDESKIRNFPTLMSKLRWILIKDIRDYLYNEEIRISMKANTILLDHKIKLDFDRERHRRQFEASVVPIKPKPQMRTPFIEAPPPPVPIIIGCRGMPSIPPPVDSFDDQIINPFQSTSAPYPSNERRTTNQILECLANDHYYKLMQMLSRHTMTENFSFIENIGQALRLFVEKHPKLSVFTIYQKFHDTIRVHIKDFSPNQRLNTMFKKLLQEFHETVIFNPKEWLLIREHTRTDSFKEHIELNYNPFDEQLVQVLHNIIIDCGYMSSGLKINYSAIEQEIPLSVQNIILRDPRMELSSNAMINLHEVVHLDDSIVGNFSPARSDTSSSTSPEYRCSGSGVGYSDSNSDGNSDINGGDINVLSPESHSVVEGPDSPKLIESSLQKTENANPIRKGMSSKSKAVKKSMKKAVPLKNNLNNKTNSNKSILKKKTIKTNINSKPKLNNSLMNGQKHQNNIRTTSRVETVVSPVLCESESTVKLQKISTEVLISQNPNTNVNNNCNTVSTSASTSTVGPQRVLSSPKPNTSVNNNCNTVNTSAATATVGPQTVAEPQRRVISLRPQSNYNLSELKSIIRRVSLSSSDDNDSD